MVSVTCPVCKVIYPLELLGMDEEVDKEATVRCSVCSHEFEVRIGKRFWMKVANVKPRLR